MNALGQRIAALIAAQGPISIAEYMTLALHDPLSGYYATRDPFGAQGDFITSPEISQMFGEVIGLWLAQAWIDQGKPARPRLVELGPGRGTLMVDALRALKLVPELREQIEVTLVEMSPALQRIQKEALKDCGVPVQWVTNIARVPQNRPLLLAANEFFDALPIRQYVKSGDGWHERMVTADANGALAFALSPVPYPAAKIPATRKDAPDGGVYETCDAGAAIVQQIAQIIAKHGGAALIVDYGYDAPGFGETLQAVKGHGFADVLRDPGASDLSAHVDFEALTEAALRGGAAVNGPVEQGHLLLALGITQRAERLGAQIAMERLILPQQMGTLFKALALVPDGSPAPTGF